MRHARGSAGAPVEAIERVYEQSYARFLRVAVAMVGDRERARDAVQETFARAIASRASFRGEGRLEAWLWGALINVCRQERRRASRNGRVPFVEPLAVATVADAGNGESVRGAIRALPERQRAVLFLRHYADLSYDEIAHALGVRRGTVAATLHAAHGGIREAIVGVRR